MQLREPEALGVLDEHDGGVRDVDSHLDDRRRHQDAVLAADETVHRLVPLLRALPPVHEADG